jgi:phage terminase large subunit
MKINLQATPVFKKNWDALNSNWRYIINEGGSRSGKTFSILQCLIIWALKNKGTSISIVRETFPSLRGSVLKDFFEILYTLELYNEKNHNKTEHIYTFDNGSKVEFFSTDSEQKIRGRKRDILYCNEANELSEEVFLQLKIRTTQKIILDWNPSDEDNFLYQLEKEEDSILIKSTYRDNPFLSDIQIKDLERLINTDEQYYRVYVLGERPTKSTRIFTHFKSTLDDSLFDSYDDISYGLDLGFNDPSVLIETRYKGDKIMAKELLYESKLTTEDLINKLLSIIPDKSKPIYSDHRPEVIEEIKRRGFNIKTAEKSIKSGIDFLKTKEIWIYGEGINLQRESKIYSWKTDKKSGRILDEVVDFNNHSMDALRYSIYSHRSKNTGYEFYTIDI